MTAEAASGSEFNPARSDVRPAGADGRHGGALRRAVQPQPPALRRQISAAVRAGLRPPGPGQPLADRPGPARDAALLERTVFEVKKVIVGQDRLVERMLVGLLAKGHLLIEGVPGVAKTLAVETFARVVGGTFSRIQFTPDLVPSDLLGTRIYRAGREEFDTELGPGGGQLRADRRDQPGAGQGAVRAARGDGRAARLHRRQHLPDA